MNTPDQRRTAAVAKARLIKDALRAAAQAKISAQAQALLAVVIAEAYPYGKVWTRQIGFDLLAERLKCSRHPITKWAQELERAQLLRRHSPKKGQVTRWVIPEITLASAACMQREGDMVAAPAQHDMQRQRCTEPVPSKQADPAPLPPADGERSGVTTPFGPLLLEAARQRDGLSRRIAREHASRGNPEALALLEQLGELVAIDDRSP